MEVSKLTIKSGTYDIKDAEARTNIQEIKKYIHSKTGQFLLIGDSYAYPSVFTSSSWVQYFISMYKLSRDVDVFVNNEGGTGFASVGSGQTFNTLIANANVPDKNKITDIIILGGYNDMSFSDEELDKGFNDVYNTVKNLYPNAQVHVGMCGWTLEYSNHSLLRSLFYRYQNMCQLYKFNYIQNVYQSLHLYYTGDADKVFNNNDIVGSKFHPNELGSRYIARNLVDYFNKCRSQFNNSNVLCTTTSFDSHITTSNLYTFCTNFTKYYYGYNLKIYKEVGGVFKTGTFIKLCKINNTAIAPANYTYIDTMIQVGDTGGNQKFYPCTLEFSTENDLSILIGNDTPIDWTNALVICYINRFTLPFDIENT